MATDVYFSARWCHFFHSSARVRFLFLLGHLVVFVFLKSPAVYSFANCDLEELETKSFLMFSVIIRPENYSPK